MKWYIHYIENRYQLTDNAETKNIIVAFVSFDMAYAYVCQLNGGKQANEVYSRWIVRK